MINKQCHDLLVRKLMIGKGTNCHKAGLIMGRFGKSTISQLRKMVEIAYLVSCAYGNGVAWQPCESKMWNSKMIETQNENMTLERGEFFRETVPFALLREPRRDDGGSELRI